jgi:hypothetical protein
MSSIQASILIGCVFSATVALCCGVNKLDDLKLVEVKPTAEYKYYINDVEIDPAKLKEVAKEEE